MSNLSDGIKKVNPFDKLRVVKAKIKPFENDLVIIIVIILVALISFGLGRLSSLRENKTPITIDPSTSFDSAQDKSLGVKNLTNAAGEGTPATSATAQGEKILVASKNGSKYYYQWCSGVSRIKEENKVWFASKEEAEKAGYTPAANCKGL